MKKKLILTLGFIYDEDKLLEFERGPGRGEPELKLEDIDMDYWAQFIKEGIEQYLPNIVTNNSGDDPMGIETYDDIELIDNTVEEDSK